MPTLQDLERKFAKLKRVARNEIPRHAGAFMRKQTLANFDAQAYLNDGNVQKWPGRKFEKYLRYPKLIYTGRLRNSFRFSIAHVGKSHIGELGTSVPYAKKHNEGGPGRSVARRRPPKSTKSVSIGGQQFFKRQFMGIGITTIKGFRRIIAEEVFNVMR